MPVNFLISPTASPIRFVQLDATPDPARHTVFEEQDWFAAAIKAYQTKTDSAGRKLNYPQKWQRADKMRPQIAVPIGRIIIATLYSCKTQATAVTITDFRSSVVAGDYSGTTALERFQYNSSLADLNVPNGRYYWIIAESNENLGAANPTFKYYISDLQEFRDSWPLTILWEYSNKRNDYDFRWNLATRFLLRVDGNIINTGFTFEDSDFEDQLQNGVKQYSGKIKEYEVTTGAKTNRQDPVPMWMMDKVTEIMRCNLLVADGRQFYRPPNATIDIAKNGNYPLYTGTTTLHGFNIDDYTRQGKKVLSYQLPLTYPFAMSSFFLLDDGQGYRVNNIVVINSVSDLNALVTQANNGGLSGTFSIDANNLLTYALGAGEIFGDLVGEVITTHLDLGLVYSTGTARAFFGYLGGSAILDYGDGTFDEILGSQQNVISIGKTYLTTTAKTFRIFYKTVSFFAATQSNGFRVSTIGGTIPTMINALTFFNQAINTIDGALFSPAAIKIPVLANVQLKANGTTSIGSIDFDGQPYLSYLDFSENKLSTNNVNDLLFAFYTTGDYPPGGSFYINQNPPNTAAPPSGNGIVAKNGLMSQGWTVKTD